MTLEPGKGIDPAYGTVKAPAPSLLLWAAGLGAALIVHLVAAIPYLAEPAQPVEITGGEESGIAVNLAPMVAPPQEVIQPEPEPEPEIPAIEERAEDSPPPAPPAQPRKTPDMPDIRPQAIPEIWGSSGGSGTLTLEEFLALEQWLAAVRQAIFDRLVYPYDVRRRAITGRAEIVVTAGREGRILDWHFTRRTGHKALDDIIERAVKRIRRLPKFPEGTKQERLSFTIPIRFELVYQGKVMAPAEEPAGQEQAEDEGLSVVQLKRCAQQAAGLAQKREAMAGQRAELERLREDYERRARRYNRERREPPRRVKRLLEQYNEGVQSFDSLIETFNTELAAYSSVCGKGSAGWNNFQQACAPYAQTGNPYCEAFEALWLRLLAGR